MIGEEWVFFAFLPALVVLVLTPELTKRTGSPAFYEAAAQVIPVFFLGIALELGLVRPRPKAPDLRIAILSIYMLGLGEFYALQSIEARSRGH